LTPAGKIEAVRHVETADGELRMVLGNTLHSVEGGRIQLLAFFEAHALDRRVINRIEVIFEELVSNVVRHGFAPGSEQSLHVRARASAETIDLVFEDDGALFDFSSAPMPAPLGTLDEAPLGGLGVPLIRRLSSDLRYERPGPGAQAGGFAPTNRLFVSVVRQPTA
jgi:anti-sigma regulatory factor (Ser/Thr protein kinase)